MDAALPAATRLAEFTSRLSYDALPGDVEERAKLHALDAIGCGLAALERGQGTAARDWAVEEPAADGAGLLGTNARATPTAAALANGMLCHALDFDDTHPPSMSHISTVVVPAVLALAQSRGSSGRDVVAAIVAGAETTTRIGMAAPGAFHARGLHPTAACGVFGAAAACSSLLGLSAERTTSALGLAGSTASGLFEYLSDGSATKPFHAGWAAQAGIVAARLAEHGATGPASVLEGRFGLYKALLGEDLGEEIAAQTADLGERWETLAIAIKAYAACHFSHAAMDGARDLRVAGVDPGVIERVELGLPEDAIPIVAEPTDRKLRPATPYEAKFSVQHSVAAMLVHGTVDLASYEEAALMDLPVARLAERITCRAVPRDDRGPFFGTVSVTLADGSVRTADVAHPEGTPESPLAPARIVEKFYANADGVLGEQGAADLASAVLGIEDAADVSTLPLAVAARVGGSHGAS